MRSVLLSAVAFRFGGGRSQDVLRDVVGDEVDHALEHEAGVALELSALALVLGDAFLSVVHDH